MATETSRNDVLVDALDCAVANKRIKSPAAGGRESIGVILHDINSLAIGLDDRVVALYIVEEIEHEYSSQFIMTIFQAANRFGVPVDVMDTAKRIFQRVAWLDNHRL